MRGTESASVDRTLAAYYGLATLVLGYVISCMLFGWIPEGAAGHPRANPIPIGWSVPWGLWGIVWVSAALVYAAPHRPLWGITAYLVLSFLFPVHSPEWILVRVSGLRTITAVLAFAAVWVRTRHQRSGSSAVGWLLSLFVAWNLICSLHAVASGSVFRPALQFHPVQLVEALLLFAAVSRLRDASTTLLHLSATVVGVLCVRTVISGVIPRDAGLATDLALAMPLLGYLMWRQPNLALRAVLACLALGGLWCIYRGENRGAVIALLFAVAGFIATSRRMFLWSAIGIPVFAATCTALVGTSFGARFSPAELLSDRRFDLIQAGFRMAMDHWFFGVGPGNFVFHAGRYEPSLEHHSAHNLWVDVAAQTGFIGLVLYAALSIAVIVASVRSNTPHTRWVLVYLASFQGIGLVLTSTMFTLPYILLAIPAVSDDTSETAS